MLVAVLAGGMLLATSLNLIAIPTDNLTQDSSSAVLRNEVVKLSEAGLDVYFYNDAYIIAGTESTDFPGSLSLGKVDDGRLYLLTKLPAEHQKPILDSGEQLLDLGSQILIRSIYDELQLRSRLSNPFTPLETRPLKLSMSNSLSHELASDRNAIQDLIAQVSADSVLYFIQSLQNFQTRYAFADNRLAVANWIKAQFQRFGISASELHNFQWQGTTQYNVVATIPGTVYPDTYIIVGGHHDSITGDNPYVFAPGADDNASGTVAAIEMARVMMASGFQPKCSIRFVTFAAEEFGLWGSKAYAQMADNTDMDIRLMINHDMIANTNPNPDDPRVLLMPYDGFMQHTDHAAAITSQYTPLVPVYGSLNLSASDSYSFWQRGFPVIYYFEYNFSQVYHSNNDTVANLNPDYCAKVIRASTAVAASYANMPSPPANVQALDLGTGHGIQVSWSASTDPSFAYYKISWGTEEGVYSNTQYTDSTVYPIYGLSDGQTCYVAVSTVDNSDNESYPVAVSAIPRLIPLTPESFVDSPVINGINLSWTANTELDMNLYKLYRSQNPDENGELIATLNPNVTTYSDSALEGSLNYYYYRLCAVDSNLHQSPFTEALKSRPVTLNLGILVIDETLDFNGSNPFQPTDEMVDSFYDGLGQNLLYTYHLDLEADPQVIKLADLGVFEAVLWHGNDYTDAVYPYSVKDALRQYIELGGKVMFSVYHPSQAFELNAGYPATFGENTFINEVLGISGVDYQAAARFKYAVSQLSAAPPLQVDPNKTPVSFNGHIFHVESLVPANANSVIYRYGSDYASSTGQGSLNDEPVAIYNVYGAGKAITLSFPLYSMESASARQFLEYVFHIVFGLPLDNDDPGLSPGARLSISAAYPNPFSTEARIELNSKSFDKPLQVQIFNLRGQLVKTLFQDVPDPKTELIWDGRDTSGRQVSSGIYLIKASQAGQTVKRKLLKIK